MVEQLRNQLAVVGGVGEGVIAVAFAGLQLFYDPMPWKLAVWGLIGLASFGGALALSHEAGAHGIDLFSRLGRRLAAVAGVVLAVFQLWYAQAAAPRRAQPSLTVIPSLKKLAPQDGMARVQGQIKLENGDARVRIMFGLVTVLGVEVRKTSFTNDQMGNAIASNPGRLYDRNVDIHRVTILKSGSFIQPDTLLEAGEKFPIEFLVYLRPQTFDYVRLRLVLLLSKADALHLDFSKENRRQKPYTADGEHGLKVSHPVIESAWVRRVTHPNLKAEFRFVTSRLRQLEETPDLFIWFRRNGKYVTSGYEQKLNRLYSIYRLVNGNDLSM